MINNRKKALIVMVAVFICVCVGLYEGGKTYGASDILLEFDSAERSYRLGEVVRLNARIVNYGTKSILLATGNSSVPIAVKIARAEKGDFKAYAPPPPQFILDGAYPPIEIRSGGMWAATYPVFWNSRPRTERMNDRDARRELETRLSSDYAFDSPGKYFVKFEAEISTSRGSSRYESEPVEIEIKDPENEDAKAWGKIKENGNIGYFMQEGDLPKTFLYRTEERDNLLKEIDSILKEYPTSSYAETLLQSREKFRSKEAQRQEFMKKMQRPTHQ